MTFLLRLQKWMAGCVLVSSTCGVLIHAQRPAPASIPIAPDAVSAPSLARIQRFDSVETLHIIVGQSLMLKDTHTIRRLYVGNSAVLQTFAASPNEVLVTAKGAGISSLVIWDANGGSSLYNVSSDIDAAGARRSLEAAYPDTQIQVRAAENRLALTGTVATAEISEGMAKLAGIYTKEVANSIRVVPVHGKQVQLKLRIIEVDRSKAEQFGVNLFTGGSNTSSASTQQFNVAATTTTAAGTGTSVSVSDALNLFFYNAKANVGVTVKDLEAKNVFQILAEPTLTTISGQAAHFLSGGEFPFPVVQGGTGSSTAISIQFRPYGVRMDFTPTVAADGTVRLKISPEVSSLDYTNAVTISGFTIPALSTRRADTEVELKDGQSFVLSGLLDRRTTENLSRVPGIASIPILGQLFRSKNINHAQTELVVMVTVTVVDPLNTPNLEPPPSFVVPNMNAQEFDRTINKSKASNTKQ